MTKQCLYGSNITASAQQFGGETVAKGMATRRLVQCAAAHGLPNGLLDRGDVNVMAYYLIIFIRTEPAGWKQPLPFERMAGIGVLSSQSEGQTDRLPVKRILVLPCIEHTLLTLQQWRDQ